LLTNEKCYFWQQNFLKPTCHKKHSVLYGEKMVKFGICGKGFDKSLHFLTNKKISGNQKPQKLFWQDFIELANNSYSYALLKKSYFQMAKFGEIRDFWQNV